MFFRTELALNEQKKNYADVGVGSSDCHTILLLLNERVSSNSDLNK
jgi:hypothetical protein